MIGPGAGRDLALFRASLARDARPRLSAAFALAFAARAAAGFAAGYSLPAFASLSFLLACASAAAASLYARSPASPPGLPDAAALLPSLAFSLLCLADSVLLGPAAASPWLLLVLLPACADSGGRASAAALSFSVAVPAAIGLAEAAGAFGGRADPPAALYLAAAAVAAAVLRAAREGSVRRAFGELSRSRDRERALAEKLDADAEAAARIQRALLLDSPASDVPGLEVHAETVASQAVDGDFYAFFPYPGGILDCMAGDVMGKGVNAALLAAAFKGAALRSSLAVAVEGRGRPPEPREVAAGIHRALASRLADLESFATFQYARVDGGRGLLDFVDAGHLPIVHYDASTGRCWPLKGTDLPLGFADSASFSRFLVPLGPGDRLLFHSDGITEAANGSGELFGQVRLEDLVRANAGESPAELSARVLRSAMYFASAAGFADDATCVCMAASEPFPSPGRVRADFPADLASLAAERAFVRAALEGEAEGLLARAELAATELASNAVIHAGASARADAPASGGATDGLETLAAAEPGEDESSAAAGPPPRRPGPRGVPAFPDIPEGFLRWEAARGRGWACLRLFHRGAAFAWHREAPPPDVQDLPSGGMGRSIVAAAADSVLYATDRDGLQMACAVFLAP